MVFLYMAPEKETANRSRGRADDGARLSQTLMNGRLLANHSYLH